MTAAELIRLLKLEPHPTEGGYFRRTYESSLRCDCGYGSRPLLTSIYYLLTQENPVGLLHRNRSDILHYHQLGAAVKYIMISPDGSLSEQILGPDIAHGESLQLLVPGGWWKAARLCFGVLKTRPSLSAKLCAVLPVRMSFLLTGKTVSTD